MNKTAGIFEVAFSVGQSGSAGFPVLPSGIYFYQLSVRPSTGSGRHFVETKKMVLLK